MYLNVEKFFIRNKMLFGVILYFIFLTFWWIFNKPFNIGVFLYQKSIWGLSYALLPISGGIYGLLVSRYFNGNRSLVGRVVIAFSVGLFLQAFGQFIYSYYTLVQQIQIPYPSLGDVGYFGSIFAYIYGVFILARYIGVTVSWRSLFNKIFTVIIPLGMIIFSYVSFLQGYEFAVSSPLKVFLDFGYPLGEAFYVSLALLILFYSKNLLGGILKKPVLLLVFALFIQYISDFYFLYQANLDIWYPGSIGDYLYVVAYLVMTLFIIYIGKIFESMSLQNFSFENTIKKNNQNHDFINPPINSLDKIFNQILTEIIKRQIRISGVLAWQEVKTISNILILDEENVQVSIVANPKKTIDQLMSRYKNFFGDLAVTVSKNAVYDLLLTLPPDEVPESLK